MNRARLLTRTAAAISLLALGQCRWDGKEPRMPEARPDVPGRPSNHLAQETSPYLLQHAHNPVDWYPWGPEALGKARLEDKPIFLSIGYSACHWCHVMEKESFENEGIAAYLNEHYVCIKVDREERPELDDIYMSSVQLMTGQGGWPLSVWLTPDMKPFYGGTYFPPEDRYGRPGFGKVLRALVQAYKTRRDEVESNSVEVTKRVASFARIPSGNGLLTGQILDAAVRQLQANFDSAYGGFGGAPKFPPTGAIQLLLREHLRRGDPQMLRMATATLDGMARGGMYDHLGGGFHRYSTDRYWLVPHFEKMLYDQALLTLAYLEAYQVTGASLYATVVRETLEFCLREMTSPEGGFYSAQDADSEGEEGRFYIWTPGQVQEVLGEREGAIFCQAYDVREGGNFEGRSIVHPAASEDSLAASSGLSVEEISGQLARSKVRLLKEREKRVHPARDEKVLTAWNGLMIVAFARAGRVLDEPRYIAAAGRAADFLLSRVQHQGRLLHVYKDGRARFPGYLDDYTDLIAGLADLYEATYEPRWLREGSRLADLLVSDFSDSSGGFFYTTDDHTDLIVRSKNAQDGSLPSGNSMAAYALLRLGRLTGRADLETKGEETLRSFQAQMERVPGALQQMLLALDLYLGPRQEVVVVGPPADERTRALLSVARKRFLPRAVLAWTDGREPETGPLLDGKNLVGGQPAAYVCRDFACDAPVTTAEMLEAALERSGARAD